ncbi:unnamed protein product [Closterium sp. NIES-54]
MRIAAKAALRELGPAINSFFLPVQFGVAVQGGAECIIHSVRALLEEDSSRVALQIDVENAFNSVERTAFMNALQWSELNPVIPLVRNLYDGPSPLLLDVAFGDERIVSTRGVCQGDPLGPLLFVATIQPTLLHIAMAFTEVAVVAYADDITVVGPPEAARRAFHLLASGLQRCGFCCNHSKSTAWGLEIIDRETELPKGISAEEDGIRVLGSPIGSPDFCAAFLRESLTVAAASCDLIGQLHPQHALLLLLAWHQATLPVRLGGLGLIDPISEAPAAYLTSVNAAQLLLQQLNTPRDHALARVATLLSPDHTTIGGEQSTLAELEACLP